MSIRLIEEEIRRSLTTTDPEVICIRGHWGVGKTYAWNKYLKDAQQAGGIALRHYAYVSLFGATSLDELKYAIFANTVGRDGIGVEPSIQTFQSHTAEIGKKLGKKLIPILHQLPFAKGYAGSVAPGLWFMAVKETIVCVDDIERRGEKLSMRDLLGLVSNLKERKRCKVILILNDDADDREKDQWGTYFEKVIDKSMSFAPTAAECVQIALATGDATSKLLRESCIKLGISNIRVLKRMEYFVDKVRPLLQAFNPEVLCDAVRSIALLGWCVYDQEKAPPLEFLERRVAIRFGTDDKKSLTESEAAWTALLDVYGFYSLQDFDLSLLNGIRNGYFDPDLVKRCAAQLDDDYKTDTSRNILTAAWSNYHDSFDDNEDEVVKAIYETTLATAESVSPTNLNGAVVVLKDLGRPEQARELIARYMLKHSNRNREFFNLDGSSLHHDVRDEDVRKAFSEKMLSYQDDREPSAILLSISKNEGWHPDDIKILADVPIDTYYTLFKTNHGAIRDAMIEASLRFAKYDAVDEPAKEISRRAMEALRRIGKESRLNARRVKKYGVKPED